MLILSENEPPKLFLLDLKKCGGRDPPDITIFLENGALIVNALIFPEMNDPITNA